MKRALLHALALLGLAGPSALAADYPFSGFFTSQEETVPAADGQLDCAFGFFRQDKDGSFINYHIDIKRFVADGSLRYVEYGRGQCKLGAAGKVETCTMSASADQSEIGQSYYDAIKTMDADTVEIGVFDSAAEAGLFATAGRGQPTLDLRIARCAGLDDTSLGPFLSTDMSDLSSDERGALMQPDLDDGKRAQAADILRKIRGNK